jgi:hypothetical protein
MNPHAVCVYISLSHSCSLAHPLSSFQILNPSPDFLQELYEVSPTVENSDVSTCSFLEVYV